MANLCFETGYHIIVDTNRFFNPGNIIRYRGCSFIRTSCAIAELTKYTVTVLYDHHIINIHMVL